MRRLMAVGMCALILAATAVALPSAAPSADAASACTDWKSTYSPPETIRVLRSYGPAAGKVQVVPFRAYVENVMSWEWPSSYPFQALRAGAVAVKQYGWYYTKYWRGGKTASGACYDVKDTSTDQIYRPETRSATSKQRRAVASTWNISIRRTRNGIPGSFILTGYLPGSIATCGAERNGYRLYQKGVKACALAGKSFETIARMYYGTTLELTEVGRHNTVGTPYGAGDLGAVVPDGTDGAVHVHRSTGTSFQPASEPATIEVAGEATLGRALADLDGDGDEELVTLIDEGGSAQRLDVRHPSGFGLDAPDSGLAWDSATAGVAFESWRDGKPAVRIVAGDVDADGDDDLMLVVTGADPTSGSIQVLESWKTSLQPIRAAFEGAFDPGSSAVFAGDTNGDGRADVVLETETADGLAYRVMRTQATPTSEPIVITGPTTWYTASGVTAASTDAVVTDYDRNGRDDVVLALPTADGLLLRGLRSTGGAFQPVDLVASSIDVDRVKLVSSDVNHDGRGDVVAYTRMADGATGTRLYVFRSIGTDLARAALWLEDTALDWQTAEPY